VRDGRAVHLSSTPIRGVSMANSILPPVSSNIGGTRIAVNYQYTPNLVGLLEGLKASLLVSTYQAGKVLVIGARSGELTISFLDYERPMGVAVGQDKIAVGAGASVHFLNANHAVAASVRPSGSHDGCFVPYKSRHTGRILVHDLGWGTEGLWVVNTLFSCLCTLDETHSFVPRWKPSFISRLVDEDRCHLNGMAMEYGLPRYVTVLAPSDTAAGWRADNAKTGGLLDVQNGEFLARGLCMPHSPRVHNNHLFVLSSGAGVLSQVDRHTGQLTLVEHMPGYTRGLAFHGQFAFVGLSKIRETNVFGGLPISERRDELCCGVAVIDMTSGRTVATLRFVSGVEEIFAVDVVPGYVNLAIGGSAKGERQNEIWVVPPEPPVHQLLRQIGASDTVLALQTRGVKAHEDGRLQEALDCLQRAIQLNPDLPELHTQLGNLHQDLQDLEAAIACYQRSVELLPLQAHTQRNLGVLYTAKNEPHRALQHFELAQKAEPHPMNLLLASKACPVIYDSGDQVTYWRNRLSCCIKDLVETGITIDTTDTIIPTTFYFAYQGENDRPLMERLARVYQGVQCCDAAKGGNWKPRGKRLRVGFVSAYFCQHTIGRLNLGVIQRLPRDQFEVIIIALQHHTDQYSKKYRKAADHHVEVSRQPRRARQIIADLGLDILIFADVGMDCLSQTLCYSRMAPIHAVTWGHPDTTGSAAVDYFISTDMAEPTDAQDHYSEQLIRLPGMGIYYDRPQLEGSRRDKSHFALNPNRRVYLCPQTLFKFHPDFDEPLRRILEADPGGDLIVIRGSTPEWVEALMDRWRRVLPDADQRIKFLPSLPRRDFLHLLSIADVMLDPFPFCGGNTTYEAIGVDTPVVTLPGQYLRGRLTHGLYQQMGDTSLSVSSVDEYVARSVRLANDRDYSSELRRTLAETSHRLYENQSEVDHNTSMLVHLVDKQSPGPLIF
jgi:uncharacterized protein (TIGR03032 family)